MTPTNAVNNLLDALKEHERIGGQIYSISTEAVRVFLSERLDMAARMKGLDPEALAMDILDAIGEMGILEKVEESIARTIEEAAAEPPELDRHDPMDGDAESALASAGFGTDEDYGYFGPDEGGWL